jgi:hypothetical protein
MPDAENGGGRNRHKNQGRHERAHRQIRKPADAMAARAACADGCAYAYKQAGYCEDGQARRDFAGGTPYPCGKEKGRKKTRGDQASEKSPTPSAGLTFDGATENATNPCDTSVDQEKAGRTGPNQGAPSQRIRQRCHITNLHPNFWTAASSSWQEPIPMLQRHLFEALP